jgi:hypothetical protein
MLKSYKFESKWDRLELHLIDLSFVYDEKSNSNWPFSKLDE